MINSIFRIRIFRLLTLFSFIISSMLITTMAFAIGITNINITSGNPVYIGCGSGTSVPVSVSYRTTLADRPPINGVLNLWEDDAVSIDGDDKLGISNIQFTRVAGAGVVNTSVRVSCAPENASGECPFSGSLGTDDENDDHEVYAKVAKKPTESNEVIYYCQKANGDIALVTPSGGLIPGDTGLATIQVHGFNGGNIDGVSSIAVNIGYDSTYLSVANAQLSAEMLELFPEYAVSFAVPGLVQFTGQAVTPAQLPEDIATIQFNVDAEAPFGNYLLDVMADTQLLDEFSVPLEVQLGSEHLAVIPDDQEKPVIHPELITVTDTSITGAPGAITDNFGDIEGYVDLSLFQNDSLGIGYTTVNPDGSFFYESESILFDILPLKLVPLDKGGNSEVHDFTFTSNEKVVFMHDVVTSPRTRVDIPVWLMDVSEESLTPLNNGTFTVFYDQNFLTNPQVENGELLQDFTVTATTDTPGQVTVSFTGTSPVNGEGDLVVLSFIPTGQIGTTTPVTFDSIAMNGGGFPVSSRDGSISVVKGSSSLLLMILPAITHDR